MVIETNDGIHAAQRFDKTINLAGGIQLTFACRTSRDRAMSWRSFWRWLVLATRILAPSSTPMNSSLRRNPNYPKCGHPDDLKTPPDPNAGRKKLRDAIKAGH